MRRDVAVRFLTARRDRYSRSGGEVGALVENRPRLLNQAALSDLGDEVVASAGSPPPHEDPLVYYAPEVDVRICLPCRIGA